MLQRSKGLLPISIVFLFLLMFSKQSHLIGLSLIILVMLWCDFVFRRVMQKNIRLAIGLQSLIIIAWIFIRLIKYQTALGTLNQYLWYSYYLFRMTLPLAGFLLVIAINNLDDRIRIPKWWTLTAIFNIAIVLAIYTNNVHHYAFQFSADDPHYDQNFIYGPLYYLSTAVMFIELFIILIIVIKKAWSNPRKSGFVLPLFFSLIIVIYCLSYVLHIPFIWNSDSTVIVSALILILNDVCIRSGLIPVNTKYRTLFEHSPLNIEILDKEGNVVMMSDRYSKDSKSPSDQDYLLLNENTIIHNSPITGGQVKWLEDTSDLKMMYQKISESNDKLKALNRMLAQEAAIKRQLSSTRTRVNLFKALDAEIKTYNNDLKEKINALPSNQTNTAEVATITLLLCYIKRRCMLFFRERETSSIPVDEIMVYLDELGEITPYNNLKLHTSSTLLENIPTREATLFYALVYSTLVWAIEGELETMLIQITSEAGLLTLKMMFDETKIDFQAEASLTQSIEAAGGELGLKDMDDTYGISLSFAKGGS